MWINFLIFPDHSAKLLDWEYAGMCDPLMDVSMCAIYSYYEEEQNRKITGTVFTAQTR